LGSGISHLCLKLSNSGDTLKLLIPSHIWKYMSGWSNYSGIVTSQKIIERAMGYRGSKSEVFANTSVKEQRVDGSYIGVLNNPMLRYTLTGSERNYQVKILSNQINQIRTYSANNNLSQKSMLNGSINPWFLTGFSDAESSFSILIQHNKNYATNYRVKAIFAVGLHTKDTAILEAIKSFWGVGSIHKHGEHSIQYRVESIKDLQVIVDHFDRYPLVTCKGVDYRIFKEAFYLIKNKEHLTEEGLSSINRLVNKFDLSSSEYKFKGIPDPQWMAGFSSGDSSFNIKVSKSETTKLGTRVQLRFAIDLHIKDKEFVNYLTTYFNLDKNKYVYLSRNSVKFETTNTKDITSVIIPFFIKYPIQGKKSWDFMDFNRVAKMINNGEHLTKEGLAEILDIKSSMNQ